MPAVRLVDCAARGDDAHLDQVLVDESLELGRQLQAADNLEQPKRDASDASSSLRRRTAVFLSTAPNAAHHQLIERRERALRRRLTFRGVTAYARRWARPKRLGRGC